MTIENTTNKVSKAYSLDPTVVAWVSKKAARLNYESENGERTNDSKLVNDILTASMEEDKNLETLKAKVRNGGKQIKELRAER